MGGAEGRGLLEHMVESMKNVDLPNLLSIVKGPPSEE